MNGKDFALAIFCAGMVAMLLRPIVSAWARRLGGGAATADLAAEVDELRQRIMDLEAERGRTLELEERLDFAERMLAQHAQPRELERVDTPI